MTEDKFVETDNNINKSEQNTQKEYASDQYVMMQYFEWYLPADGKHWERLGEDAQHLSELGVSGVWVPPCSKGTSADDVGYGIYDLYDLGEFDQKGTIRTKYGTREQLEAAIDTLHEHGLKVYADIVLNHKAGADATEKIKVIEVDPQNRSEETGEPFEIEAWTRFDFPGRGERYSDFKWCWHHFTATDYDATGERTSVFKIIGENKDWAENVDDEFGNYDYLMFADVDYHHPDVIEETINWGRWLIDQLRLDGMRLDAVKHINEGFVEDFVKAMREHVGADFYAVGEYWKNDTERLAQYLSNTDHQLALFDVALHFNFYQAALQGREYDLRTIFDNTLVKRNPMNVATFVDNHDSQLGQALESWVGEWFKPLAYALILLREDGYPCLFYGDYYGIGGDTAFAGMKETLDILLAARKEYAYGEQLDYFDHANVIAWQRLGIEARPGSGLVAIISNGEEGHKFISFGAERAGTVWIDMTGNRQEEITLDADGAAEFNVNGGSVSIWIMKES